jgi:hypothetical protein
LLNKLDCTFWFIEGRQAMKSKFAVVLTLCLLAATTAFAQWTREEEIEGVGTPGYVPVFTGHHKVGNSNIFQSPGTNVGIGTTTPLFPLHIFSNNTAPPPGQDSPITLFVETPTAVNSGGCANCAIISIEGLVSTTNPSANVIGVQGLTFSPSGVGVLGNHPVTNGGGGGGVLGLTNATNGVAYATRGTATASTGSAVALFGETFSQDGWPAYLVNRASGNLIVGVVGQNPDVSVFRVDGTGKVFADGGFQPNGADFAASMVVAGDRAEYAAGDLLVIDASGGRRLSLTLSERPYSTLVAGIYSTKPGMLGTTRRIDSQNESPYDTRVRLLYGASSARLVLGLYQCVPARGQARIARAAPREDDPHGNG